MIERKMFFGVTIICVAMLFIGILLGWAIESNRQISHIDDLIDERGEIYAGECFDQRKDLRRVLAETKEDLATCETVKNWKLNTIEYLKAENAICQHDLDSLRDPSE